MILMNGSVDWGYTMTPRELSVAEKAFNAGQESVIANRETFQR